MRMTLTLYIQLLLCLIFIMGYKNIREGIITLVKDILLGVTYVIAGIIRLTRKIINLFKIGRK